MKKIICAFLLLAASTTAVSQTAPPYTLENTEVLSVSSKELKREYEVFVSRSESYKRPPSAILSFSLVMRIMLFR